MSDWTPPPDVLPGYDDWLLHGQGGPRDDERDDDGYVSRGRCLTLLASAWVLLAAAAWSTGAPMSSSIIDAALAVAVMTVTLAAWRDRDEECSYGPHTVHVLDEDDES